MSKKDEQLHQNVQEELSEQWVTAWRTTESYNS